MWHRAAVLAVWAGVACAQPMDWASIPTVEAGFSAAKLEAWRSSLADHGTTGLIVIRRGRIALEWYAPGWDAERPHGTASMAKALVGGLSLAVAMSEGRISPDDPASKYIAGWSGDPLKSKITIRHLATHTSGISDAEQEGMPHDRLPGGKAISGSARPIRFRSRSGRRRCCSSRGRSTRTATRGWPPSPGRLQLP